MKNEISVATLLDVHFSAGRSGHLSKPTGVATVRMITGLCRKPGDYGVLGQPLLAVADVVDRHGDAVKRAGSPMQAEYNTAKAGLPWITPCALFAPNVTRTTAEAQRNIAAHWYEYGRRAGNEPHTPTGLVVTEVDGQSQDDAAKLRDMLFAHPAVLSVRLSASRKGVHILTAAEMPSNDVWTQEEYHAAWGAVVGALGLRNQAEKIASADKSVKDFTRLLYLSYDPDTRLRESGVLQPIAWALSDSASQRPPPRAGGGHDDIAMAQEMLEALLPYMGAGSGTYDRCIGAAGLAIDVGVSEDWVRDWYRRVRPSDAKVDGQLPRAGHAPLLALASLDTLQSEFTGARRTTIGQRVEGRNRLTPADTASYRKDAQTSFRHEADAQRREQNDADAKKQAAVSEIEALMRQLDNPVSDVAGAVGELDDVITMAEFAAERPRSGNSDPWCARCAKDGVYHRIGAKDGDSSDGCFR